MLLCYHVIYTETTASSFNILMDSVSLLYFFFQLDSHTCGWGGWWGSFLFIISEHEERVQGSRKPHYPEGITELAPSLTTLLQQ